MTSGAGGGGKSRRGGRIFRVPQKIGERENQWGVAGFVYQTVRNVPVHYAAGCPCTSILAVAPVPVKCRLVGARPGVLVSAGLHMKYAVLNGIVGSGTVAFLGIQHALHSRP